MFIKDIGVDVMTARLFLAHAVFSLFIYAVLGASYLIDLEGLVWIVALDFIAWLAIIRASERTAGHVLVFSWLLVLFFLSRLTAYLISPPSSISFPTNFYPTGNEVAASLRFFVLG